MGTLGRNASCQGLCDQFVFVPLVGGDHLARMFPAQGQVVFFCVERDSVDVGRMDHLAWGIHRVSLERWHSDQSAFGFAVHLFFLGDTIWFGIRDEPGKSLAVCVAAFCVQCHYGHLLLGLQSSVRAGFIRI